MRKGPKPGRGYDDMINSTQLFVADLLQRFGFFWHLLNEDKG